MPKPSDESQLLLAGDHLALLFPYIPDQIAELKAIDGAKWDRLSRTWRLPMRSAKETIAFAHRHGFWISPDVTSIQLPPRPGGEPRIELNGETLSVFFAYDPVKVQSIKQVPGATWNSTLIAWQAPLSNLKDVVEWADEWGMAVPAGLRARMRGISEHKTELHQLSTLEKLEEPLDIPELAMELYDFQHVGVKYALQTRRTFIADQMGLGKTAQAIATLSSAKAFPAVIVVPPSLLLNWVYELRQWLPERRVVALSGMIKKQQIDAINAGRYTKTQALADWDQLLHSDTVNNHRQRRQGWAAVTPKTAPDEAKAALETAEVLVIGYATLGAWLPLLQKLVIAAVFDESQYIKTPTAKRTKAAKKLTKGFTDDAIVLCLTGTPVASRPAEYAAQLEVLGRLDGFGGIWSFYQRYCAAFKDKWGQLHIEGHSNMEELNEKLRSSCYVRRMKTDVLPELGERRSVPLYVEGDEKVMKEYAEAERDIATYMANRAAEIAEELGENPRSAAVIARIKAESAQHLVRMSALRRIAAKAKIKAVEELVASHISEGSKVVLAAHHREVVTGLADQYGGYMIIGGQDIETTERVKERFQTAPVEDVPVIVLSTQAAKTGHTLTAAQDIIIVELPWTPADFDQVVDRLHRIGQTGSVLATSVLCVGTIDEPMWEMLADKRRVVSAVTDGTPLGDEGGSIGDLLVGFAMKGLQ